jgi:hypothetical protein
MVSASLTLIGQLRGQGQLAADSDFASLPIVGNGRAVETNSSEDNYRSKVAF